MLSGLEVAETDADWQLVKIGIIYIDNRLAGWEQD